MTKDKTNKEVVEEVVEVVEKDLDTAEVIEDDIPVQAPANQPDDVEQKELQDKIAATSAKIQAILQEDGMALQPLMNISQFGIRPDIALVPVPEAVPEPTTEPEIKKPTPITENDIAELVKEDK